MTPCGPFEPHVAERTFEDLVAEAKVPVIRGMTINEGQGVKKVGAKIVALLVLFPDPRAIHGRVFIDATYEGDLMAAAGVSYAVGASLTPNTRRL